MGDTTTTTCSDVSNPPPSSSAAQHALALPELLATIFAAIPDGGYDPPHQPIMTVDRAGALYSCCLVNRTWYSEARPLLWGKEFPIYDEMDYGPDLIGRFANIPADDPAPYLRRRHAQFVKNAQITVVVGVRPPQPGGQAVAAVENYDLLAALAFPRLKSVYMRLLDSDGAWEGENWYIPRIGPNRVEELKLDSRYEENPEKFGVRPDEWVEILEQIVDTFPHLQKITFVARVLIREETLSWLWQRLPSLSFGSTQPHLDIDTL